MGDGKKERMKTLNFYHQKRKDGGLRTGVEVNGTRVLELFRSTAKPLDPKLDWFVDVRWQGSRLPSTPEAIRAWLLEQGNLVQQQLQETADELSAGIDSGWPMTKEFSGMTKGISGKIVCSAARRLHGRDIRRVLLALKKAWPDLISSLPAFHLDMAA